MRPSIWLASYDIASPRRRRRVAELLLGHGDRVQKSLYECALTADQPALLRRRALTLIDTTEDKLMIRPLCRHCREATRYQGQGGHPERREPFWII